MATTNQQRCINLDWLEVHVLEPQGEPHNAEYYRQRGYNVMERPYGTRVYREMFTIYDDAGHPFLEVRRNPASQGLGGIHLPEESHLRLTNYACYSDDAALLMQQFIDTHHYTFNRISRVDICLDFERFDTGDEPQRFLKRYMQQKYSKINQGNIHAHGAERWSTLDWNSCSWGAPSSDIGTKFYNKTMELYNQHDASYSKPYIRWAWYQCGLVDDPVNVTKTIAGETYTPQIWRLEFSIRSSVKNWFVIEVNGNRRDYQSIRNTLEMYANRDRLLLLFASLTQHYFHFKYLQFDEHTKPDGTIEKLARRKDRCPDKELFRFTGQQYVYKVAKEAQLIGTGEREHNPLRSLINKLRHYCETHPAQDIHRAAQILIDSMERENLRRDMLHPWSYEEIKALQLALQQQTTAPATNVAILLQELKEFLRINDRTAIF